MGRVPPPRAECQGTLPRSWLPAQELGEMQVPWVPVTRGRLHGVHGSWLQCRGLCEHPQNGHIFSVCCRSGNNKREAASLDCVGCMPVCAWEPLRVLPPSQSISCVSGLVTIGAGLCVRTRRYPGCSSWPPALCAITRHAHWDHIH